eukprot:354015-Chlamydomonas_euryale.AAC.4
MPLPLLPPLLAPSSLRSRSFSPPIQRPTNHAGRQSRPPCSPRFHTCALRLAPFPHLRTQAGRQSPSLGRRRSTAAHFCHSWR